MLTHFDVQNLNNSIEGAGEGFLKRRAMQQQHEAEMSRMGLESQMRDIQQSRYDAQAKHFQEMEDVGNSRNAILAQDASTRQSAESAKEQQIKAQELKKYGVDQLNQQFARIQTSVNNGEITPDEATRRAKTVYQQHKDAASGAVDDAYSQSDFGSAIKDDGSFEFQKGTPISIQTLPNGQPVVTGKKGDFKLGELPPKAPTGYTETSVKQVPDPLGGTNAPISLTNSITRTPTGYPAPASPAAAPSQPGTVPTINSQNDYDALPVGSQYRDSQGNLGVKKPRTSAQ